MERVEHSKKVAISRTGQAIAEVVPLVRRADRTARGSLRGQLELGSDWDSERTNAEIAEDFGLAP